MHVLLSRTSTSGILGDSRLGKKASCQCCVTHQISISQYKKITIMKRLVFVHVIRDNIIQERVVNRC